MISFFKLFFKGSVTQTLKTVVAHVVGHATLVPSANAKPPPTSRQISHGIQAWNSFHDIKVSIRKVRENC